MNKQIKVLSIVTLSLFIFSILTYLNEHRRGSGVIDGSEFIAGLDIDKVYKFTLKRKDNTISFYKEDGKFVLQNHYSYPADSERINDLLYQLSNLQIAEEIGSDKDSYVKFEVAKDNAQTQVTFFDKNDKKIFDFYVGKIYKSKGNYLRHSNQDKVYLSTSPLHLSASKNNYINKTVLNLPSEKVKEITAIRKNKKYTITKDKDKFVLINDRKAKWDETKIKQFIDGIKDLSFTEFYPQKDTDDLKVSNLKFNDSLEIKLNNNLIYKLLFAKNKDKYYLKTTSYLNEAKQQFVINRNDNKEKLENIADVITAQENANYFNLKHGKWVYTISKGTFEKFIKAQNDFKKI